MTLAIKKLEASDEARWDEYANRAGASIYHVSKWRHLIKKVFGHDSYYLYALDGDKIRGILPLINLKSRLFGNFLVSMPYFNYGGVVADNDETGSLLLTEAGRLQDSLNTTHVELRELDERDNDLPVRTDKVTMLLELPSDPDELWKSIGAKRRAQVKRPIREGVEFVVGGKELLDDFYSVFSINMRDLGTPVYSKSLFASILEYFPDETFISMVRLNGEAVAAGFLIGWKGKLEIPWASTLRKVNRIGVNMYLYWNILKTSIEKGYKTFDFGRSSKDAGTLKFKKQWGAKETQLYWRYLMESGQTLPGLNPSNPKFKLAIAGWKRLPLPIANLLGPFIVKGLP